MTNISIPNYKQQNEAVKDRFDRLKQRPVTMEVKGLTKEFNTNNGKVTALKDINLSIYKREFVCVIGPSGCGKSTLIRILAGLESATSGQVLLDGKEVTKPGPERGMVFQGYTLFPWLTVKQNIMFGLIESGEGKDTAEANARQWADLIGLSKFENHYPNQLSGGMKQRVAIARALANQPKILLMDEPFGALDAQTRSKMQAYLMEIWKNIDITVFFITHDLDEAVYLADRILVLKANPGEIEELIEVPVPQPRNAEQFLSPEFLATKQHIESLIHPKTDNDDDDHMNLVRMVNVKSDVGSVF
ncbi:ABC transporter ATP-binding protein [Psychromonas sp. KJ10-10]|uniref:ABC transporter ATP-binding protein n=1 Tax=Psychromonas sp. KJ10-10 TaxID=3391823 RepID=UPI0039B51DB2